MSYSARRPYLHLADSIRELFQAPIRYMKETLQKESVFEKPYLSGDAGYREMHIDPPGPNPPDKLTPPKCGTLICFQEGDCDRAICFWKLDDWSPPLPMGYHDKGVWHVAGSAYEDDCCFDYIQSHFDNATYGMGGQLLKGGPGIRFKVNRNGAIPNPDDEAKGICTFFIEHVTEWNYTCRWKWEIECPRDCTFFNLVVLCVADGAQLGYGSACDTVARNNHVTVKVGGEVGGEPAYPNYKWTLSGTGFHFDAADGPTTKTTTSEDDEVDVYADATACGTCTITVTDSCGNTGTDYLLCTEGTWNYVDDSCSYPGTYETVSNDGAPYPNRVYYFDRVVGKYKQRSSYKNYYSASSGGYNFACGDCSGCGSNDECVELNCAAINALVPTKCSDVDCITCVGDGDGAGNYKSISCFDYEGSSLYVWECS